MSKPERLGDVDKAADAEAAVSAVEGEIREFVRRDVSTFRRSHHQPEVHSEAAAENISSLIQRISGASITEVERVVSELSVLRDTLRSEGDRLQRDIAAFASLSQAALTSTRIIAESLDNWKPEQSNLPKSQAAQAPHLSNHSSGSHSSASHSSGNHASGNHAPSGQATSGHGSQASQTAQARTGSR